MNRTMLLAFLLAACDPEGDGRGTQGATHDGCSLADRSGDFSTASDLVVSGECDGPNPGYGLEAAFAIDFLDAPLQDDCVLDAPDVWSEGDCKLERRFSCELWEVSPGIEARMSTVALTTQITADASVFSGTMTQTTTGVGIPCGGTFNIVAERQ